MRELGQRLAADWQATYTSLQGCCNEREYSPDAASAGRRALRNLSLAYLAEGETEGVLDLAREQLVASTNMTDAHGALAVIVNSASPLKAEALIQLARVWSDQPLLMNKWFQLQATAMAHPGEPPVVDRVRLLMRHPGFSLSNPNNVNALDSIVLRAERRRVSPSRCKRLRVLGRSGAGARQDQPDDRRAHRACARSLAQVHSRSTGCDASCARTDRGAARPFARRVRDRQQIACKLAT